MVPAPPDKELQEFLEEFFEEVWQVAELAAGSEDRDLAPHLFALAGEIAQGYQRVADAPEWSIAELEPQPADASQRCRQETVSRQDDVDSESRKLDIMAERIVRQRVVVSRMECTGNRAAIALAYQLLQILENSMETVRNSRETVRNSRAIRAYPVAG
jgi:hypothetical protein